MTCFLVGLIVGVVAMFYLSVAVIKYGMEKGNVYWKVNGAWKPRSPKEAK